MPTVELFHPLSYAKVGTISDIMSISLTVGLTGEVNGTLTVERTAQNSGTLNGLKQGSHFLKIKVIDKTYGAIVKASSHAKNIQTIEVTGFMGYMETIAAIPSHKANSLAPSVTIPDNDESWVKTFYADGGIGILYGVFKNLRDTMNAQGFNPCWDESALLNDIEDISDSAWAKTYRLNALDLTNMKSIISEVLSEEESAALVINLANSQSFAWSLDILKQHPVTYINEATESIFNISIDAGEQTARRTALATGTNLAGDSVLSSVEFDGSTAYSTYIKADKTEASDSIQRKNAAQVNALRQKTGQLSFSTYVDTLNVLDAVVISSEKMPEVRAIITEIVYEGTTINVTAQITDGSQTITTGIAKPVDFLRRTIFNPLNEANALSRKNALQQQRGTGWRS